MHKMFYIVVCAACFISIDCQGGGVGGGRFGRGFGGVRSGLGSSCRTKECLNQIFIDGFAVVGCICIYFIILCLCLRCRQAKHITPFVSSDSTQQQHEMQSLVAANVFQSGIWTGRHFQYGKWHGPNEMLLRFDAQSTKVTGWGSDDVGQFTVNGICSQLTLGLTKTYRAGTGNKAQNSGHSVDIQLTKNGHSQQFEGKWNVQTSSYHGENSFELKFKRNFECEEV